MELTLKQIELMLMCINNSSVPFKHAWDVIDLQQKLEHAHQNLLKASGLKGDAKMPAYELRMTVEKRIELPVGGEEDEGC